MKIYRYQFPENTPEEIRLKEGCAVILKSGSILYVTSIPDEKRDLVDYVEDSISGISLGAVLSLIKEYGGVGFTEHIDRDGGVLEVTEIKL